MSKELTAARKKALAFNSLLCNLGNQKIESRTLLDKCVRPPLCQVADDVDELAESLEDEFSQLKSTGWEAILPSGSFTLGEYKWATSIVSSRGFASSKVDGGFILAPLADFAVESPFPHHLARACILNLKCRDRATLLQEVVQRLLSRVSSGSHISR